MMFYCQSLSTIIVTFNAFNTVFFVVVFTSSKQSTADRNSRFWPVFSSFWLFCNMYGFCEIFKCVQRDMVWREFFFRSFSLKHRHNFPGGFFLYKSWYCILNYLFKVYPFDVLTCFLYNRWSFFRFSVFSNSKKILNFD